MFQIDYLQDKPEFIDTVSSWIFTEFIDPDVYSLDYIQEFYKNRFYDRCPITFVAHHHNRCIGTVSLFENDLKSRMDLLPWLAALYVSPASRNAGFGKALVSRVLDKARELNYPRIYLRTENASAYYKKLGWAYMAKGINEKHEPTYIFSYQLI